MGFLWAVNLLIPLAAVSLGIMLPPMTEELGISPIQAGLLGASWFLGSALGVAARQHLAVTIQSQSG